MPVIQREVSVAAGAVNDNVFAGSAFEFARGNQVVSGVAINIVAAGLTVVLGNAWFGRGGQTPDLPPEARFMPFAATTKYGTRVPSFDVAHCWRTSKREPSNVGSCALIFSATGSREPTRYNVGGTVND